MAKVSKRKIKAADLFCGAGGTSTGLVMAANALKADLELIAVNHWEIAIDTHSVNHPYAKHACTGIDSVDPRKLIPGGYLDILCASPECTHHSNARGGKPMSDQSRSSAWHILRFCEALYIANVVIENVVEFQNWGPLGRNGRPLKSKRGELFHQFLSSLEALGYRVEYRVLNCADYGDPTSRRRLFIVARRGGKKISWPQPTHASRSILAEPSLFADERKPWRTAREIIDWSIPSQSIFERKKPLAPNTIKRIQAGVKKYWGVEVDVARCITEGLKPFIVVMRNHGDARSIDEPLPTLTAGGTHVGVVEPFMVTAGGTEGQGRVPASVQEPVGTVLTNDRRSVVEPFVLQTDHTGGGGSKVRDLNHPVPTLVTKANTCLVEPFLSSFRGNHSGREDGTKRNLPVDSALPTQDTSNRFGVVEPFLLGQQSGAAPRSVDQAVPTVAAAGAISLTEPFMVLMRKGQGPRDINDPIATLTTSGANYGVAEPFIVPQFGEREGQSPRTHCIDDPAPAVTSHGAGALVEPFMLDTNHSDGLNRRIRSLEDPMPTLTCSNGTGIVEGKAFIVEYYDTQNMIDVDSPVPAVIGNDRFALVEGRQVERYQLDIRFRMLQPKELAAAQGFPVDYKFSGTKKDVVKQIGNAVPPSTAMSLILECLGGAVDTKQAA